MAQINIQGNPMQEEHDRLNGKPKHIVLPESDENNSETPFYGNCMHCWGTCCGCMRTWAPCICCCFVDYPYKIVPQSYAGIYQKFGRYVRTVTPGLHYINPCTETLGMISLKINVLDLARQVAPSSLRISSPRTTSPSISTQQSTLELSTRAMHTTEFRTSTSPLRR